MLWLTWRQFRAQAYVTVAILVVAVTVLTIAGIQLGHLWADSGAASCPATGECAALDSFISAAKTGFPMGALMLSAALNYLVPVLIGLFWGAPLVARELETGTQRLVWNQSITRARWLATKLALLGLAAMAFAGLLSLAGALALHRIDAATANRITPVLFGARGIVPIAYAAFAFVLGVIAGMIIRRTVPAMATTVALYAAATLSMPLGLRGHLLPIAHLTRALDVSTIHGIGIHNETTITINTDDNLPGAWVLTNRTIGPNGAPFTGPANMQACGRNGSPKTCFSWIDSLGLRQQLTYQPASHFWPLQWVESGIFLALTALLVAFGFWWLRRRSA